MEGNYSHSVRANSTGSGYTTEDVIFLTYYYGLFVLIACVNIPGNIIVVVTVLRHQQLRQPCNYYISSLAVSDLMLGVFYPLYNLSHIGVPSITFPLGNWYVCRILVTKILALSFCSSYHLVAITATRYIAIVYPLRYHHYVTRRGTLACIAALWVVSYATAVAQYAIYIPVNYRGVCQYEEIFPLSHVTVLMVLQLFLPLGIMFALYYRIASIARRHARVLYGRKRVSNGRLSYTKSNSIMGREVKSTIMVAILLSSFVIGWTPVVTYFYICVTCPTCKPNRYFRASARVLLYLASAVNIFIYAGRLGNFREYILRDLRTLRHAIRRQ